MYNENRKYIKFCSTKKIFTYSQSLSNNNQIHDGQTLLFSDLYMTVHYATVHYLLLQYLTPYNNKEHAHI